MEETTCQKDTGKGEREIYIEAGDSETKRPRPRQELYSVWRSESAVSCSIVVA